MGNIEQAIKAFSNVLDSQEGLGEWRFYSPPIDDERAFHRLRAYLESGKLLTQAMEASKTGDYLQAWRCLSCAQAAWAYPQTPEGKALRDKAQRSDAGKAGRLQDNQDKTVAIAIRLFNQGHSTRGLTPKVAVELSKEGYNFSDSQVRIWLKDLIDMLKS